MRVCLWVLQNHLATMEDSQKGSMSDAVSEAEMCAWQILSAQYALLVGARHMAQDF